MAECRRYWGAYVRRGDFGKPPEHPSRASARTSHRLSRIESMSFEVKPAVVCRDLHKHFGEGEARVQVLRGVNFQARQGELTFLVGPSGCGKTTLISVIAGLLNSTGGEVEVLDQKTEKLSAAERILFRRRNLGFVFQQYNLLPALTARENAAVPLLAA